MRTLSKFLYILNVTFHSFKYQRKTNLKIDTVITDMSWVYYQFKTKNKA